MRETIVAVSVIVYGGDTRKMRQIIRQLHANSDFGNAAINNVAHSTVAGFYMR